MNETLKKDLCARLPYGVKMQYNDEIYDLSALTTTQIGFTQNKKLRSVRYSDEILPKPILFPISCLTKEITVNGETFVPIVEIGKLHLGDLYHSFEVPREDKYCIGFNSKYGGWSFYNFKDYNSLPNWIIELLQKWHINYRLAPNEFIEATNEYE